MRCLVLGGSGAVGQEVCRALAARGARVWFTYCLNEAAASSLCAELPSARAARLDVLSIPDLERTMDEAAAALGGLDALVHCAAINATEAGEARRRERLDDVDPAGFDRMMAINVRSAFFALRRFARHLPATGGNAVLFGSIDGVKVVPAPVAYAASKGAVSIMAQAMAKELGPINLRVNVVAPGLLEGGLSRTLPEELTREYLKHSAQKRLGTFREVAELAAFLALENTYVTGRTLVVDGGL